MISAPGVGAKSTNPHLDFKPENRIHAGLSDNRPKEAARFARLETTHKNYRLGAACAGKVVGVNQALFIQEYTRSVLRSKNHHMTAAHAIETSIKQA
jgi:hypothetical protein